MHEFWLAWVDARTHAVSDADLRREPIGMESNA